MMLCFLGFDMKLNTRKIVAKAYAAPYSQLKLT